MKKLIQVAWVAEVAVLLAYIIVASYTLPIEHWNELLKALPTIGGLIAGQGGAAFAGPEIKRFIEAWLEKIRGAAK